MTLSEVSAVADSSRPAGPAMRQGSADSPADTEAAGRPRMTGQAHPLPFLVLDPSSFERMCLWLVPTQGYEDVAHYGVGGSDKGRDVVAFRNDGAVRTRWYFQCKRVRRATIKMLTDEIDKIVALPADESHPSSAAIVFVIAGTVSAATRDAVSRYAHTKRVVCEFWARTELDAMVKHQLPILREFFQIELLDPSQDDGMGSESGLAKQDSKFATTEVGILLQNRVLRSTTAT